MGQDISGKIAYITGGSSGIGRAAAHQFAKEGVHLGLIARRKENLEKVQQELETYGVNIAICSADISKHDQVKTAVQQFEQELGKADILINNAAISDYGNFQDMEEEVWKHIFEVNVFGTYHVLKEVLPHLVSKQKGDIINISSSNGLKATAGSTAYSASKFAIQGMSEALMQEVRKENIRVFTMNPSLVATELAFGDKLEEKNEDKFMQPEDIAEYMVAQLKLNQRIFIKQSAQWATNPF
ncbi:3-ketoacyl-ACP reductase [Oceanobacillus neutriphilus]|uniref:Oxidoreductase YoxD n=1 Tax=Oceanobacillus neutriphilus TaxID=531815 RepID=A0ABQ2NTV0_9BACI|nr:3-ketoacyl-ACP reductase [Oceanobacillus neutriphilus]GGP10373.1 putative oxidoreductase YoxD [Oceanobacillus neutriphilus]